MPSRPDPLRILAVCTGNVCRSPVMEVLLSERLGSTAVVESAGTRALPGAAVPEETRRALARAGYAMPEHRARRITADQVASADLVLAAAREHRADAVRLAPVASAYTFTVAEFARLGADLGAAIERGEEVAVASLRDLTARLAARRGFVPPVSPATADDVVDPFGRSARVHRSVVARLLGALASLEPVLPSVAGLPGAAR